MRAMARVLVKLCSRSGGVRATMTSLQSPASLRLAAISYHLQGSGASPVGRSLDGQERSIFGSPANTPPGQQSSRPSNTPDQPTQHNPPPSASIEWSDPSNYRYWLPVQTRWSDNDAYGHMNNTKYYELFDTIVNKFLREECKEEEPSMGLVVHSECNYLKPVGFPTRVIVGLATEHIGRSSVVWRVAVWSTRAELAKEEGIDPARLRDDLIGCHAFGNFVHVFVDQSSRKKTEITQIIRSGASRLLAKNH
ncbi:hypothetical protein PTTG_27367 [Puccinia triticina 1-1 BBBD Race 1]|uniref:4HBT domain-containing protein n=1 Tax=Puccinia triticina (isolate 1-1 / race 1 (BBBD)) TaxID=630390 RepID=A0A180GKZ8_PUCT1|nr:hypothetical protein PTTG_27367 [Puccinia triticina 1-1 BBBD Race 1]